MSLRRVSAILALVVLVLSSGCCWCHHGGEHRGCRHPFHCAKGGDAGCTSCYSPSCDCGGPIGPSIMSPAPVIAPMPRTTTTTSIIR